MSGSLAAGPTVGFLPEALNPEPTLPAFFRSSTCLDLTTTTFPQDSQDVQDIVILQVHAIDPTPSPTSTNTMLPLIPTLALAFVSFICSAFVVLRIVIPILPPHPLSRRVPPSEFGLPNFKTLSPADKSHIWLASCDILALAIFVWQAVVEHSGGPTGFAVASDPASAVRIWFATTLRQSCLLIVASLTLLHVRLGRPVDFGGKHWMLWAPTLLLAATSTALAGVLAGTTVSSFFWGILAYTSTLAVLSTVAFGCLIGTLVIIKRNLSTLNEIREPWPPAKQVEDKPRPSFATEDIDAMKDGSSWITSRASSRQDSISAFSFSTHHSRAPSNASSRVAHPALASNPSIPAKSSFWFNPATPHNGRESPVPPVPPLPAPYRPTGPAHESLHGDPDPFRRDEQGVDQRMRLGSQSSWLSERSDQVTMSAWSFPATQPPTPAASTTDLHTHLLPSSATAFTRPHTPAMVSTDVLGGYGYAPEAARAEQGGPAQASVPASDLDVSVFRTAGWLVSIWVPFALSMPYFAMTTPGSSVSSIASLLLVLSVTLSSPLLALNILVRSPIPIPSGLFETYSEPPSVVMRAPSAMSTNPSFTHEYKRSGSVTVVEGRRSGDIWIANGDAVEGKTKFGRAVGMLSAKPKLAVIPPMETNEFLEVPLTPTFPMQTDDNLPSVPQTPQSQMSAEMGMRRVESKASSYYSNVDESVAFATQIMIAQRHYSALAQTLVLPPSPEHKENENLQAATTGMQPAPTPSKRNSHLRARSITSSINSGSHSPISPPPALPLPPTPPSVKERKAARSIGHRKSYSSGFSFGAIDNTQEIDALSAGLLPLLVPGLKIGSDIRIRESWVSNASVNSKGSKNKRVSRQEVPGELGGFNSIEFSSPQLHSTPHERKAKTTARNRKESRHKRHHFSLPSLSLGKDGIHSLTMWRNEINNELDHKLEIPTPDARRNTMHADPSSSHLNAVPEEDERARSPVYPHSPRESDVLLPADVPNTARNSLATLISALDQELRMPPPPSAASDVTLFDFDPSQDAQAESTPHDSRKTSSKYSREESAPPVPPLPPKVSKRSSIVYIKSDENAAPVTAVHPTTSPRRVAEWTSRIRPLIPKSKSSKQAKAAKHDAENQSAGTPGGSLRPLSLLQDRDVNRNGEVDTRPHTSGKKKQKHVVDENAAPSPRKGLKPLKLIRSETTKQRATLRENETLPEVVVRPPSQYYAYEASAF
ncbi:hypothetical protein EIP91_005249 [Steccherinum ochraceum]|uniref:Uncharacterized protein n=1 Tax=Steccherinum ochraceum TaxID=92696 RepID=A0A4R0RW01_9APHY|nr:hypothetical protein EIP91_005249 [Steccherinum ochraceum]